MTDHNHILPPTFLLLYIFVSHHIEHGHLFPYLLCFWTSQIHTLSSTHFLTFIIIYTAWRWLKIPYLLTFGIWSYMLDSDLFYLVVCIRI